MAVLMPESKSVHVSGFLGVFHVRFLDFDQRFEKLVKFCTKAMFVIFLDCLNRENPRIIQVGLFFKKKDNCAEVIDFDL